MFTSALYLSFAQTMESFGPWPKHPQIGIAVSGGPDSLALLQLAHQWATSQQGSAIALHVDHRLRPTSRQEANDLNQFCEAHNIPCHLLVWKHGAVHTRIQQSAREARYHLLMEKCKTLGLLHLLTGHHQNDHLETIYMREERQSGPRGLAGIRPIVWTSSVRILRPLLEFNKKELLEYAKELPYIQDPSNTNSKFTRVRTRYALSSLSEETIQQSLATSKKLQTQNTEEEKAAWQYLAAHASFHPFGFVKLMHSLRQTSLTTLAFILQYISGKMYLPSQKKLEASSANLIAHPEKAYTLHTCIIWNTSQNWYFSRECRRSTRVKIERSQSFYWDHRFLVDLITKKHLYLGLELDMLGRKGWQQVRHRYRGKPQIPWRILQSLPAFWHKDRIISVPHLGIHLTEDALPRLRFLPKYDMLKFEILEKE